MTTTLDPAQLNTTISATTCRCSTFVSGSTDERYKQPGPRQGAGHADRLGARWRQIEPVFGDVDPRTVGLEDVDLWYSGDPAASIKGMFDTIA